MPKLMVPDYAIRTFFLEIAHQDTNQINGPAAMTNTQLHICSYTLKHTWHNYVQKSNTQKSHSKAKVVVDFAKYITSWCTISALWMHTPIFLHEFGVSVRRIKRVEIWQGHGIHGYFRPRFRYPQDLSEKFARIARNLCLDRNSSCGNKLQMYVR